MSFQDDLRTTIQTAKADKESYERESREFEKQWDRLRDTRIANVFRDAASVLNDEEIETHREPVNGSIVLRAVKDKKGKFLHYLAFKSNVRSRTVLCSSDLFDDEAFSLDYVTESMVQAKVEKFADRMFRKDIPE